MPLSLFTEVIRSDGLQHEVALGLSGRHDELLRVRTVRYDLGPTFLAGNRFRTLNGPTGVVDEPTAASLFTIHVQTYGNFDVTADVAVGDGRVEHLRCTVVTSRNLPALEDVVRSFEHRAREAPASAGAAMWLGIALGTATVVLAGVAVILGLGDRLWPGSRVDPSAGLSPAARLALLAAGAGGLGAALQALYAMRAYVDVRPVVRSWVPWLLLRIPTGLVLGLVVWLIVSRFFLAPDARFASLAAIGLAGLALAAGFTSGRATTLAQDLLGRLAAFIDLVNGVRAAPAPSADGPKPVETDLDRDTRLAERVLRGGSVSVQDAFNLAKRLQRSNKFGHARRLYERLWATGDWSNLNVTAARVGQNLAIATYKDPDVPAVRRFKRALEVLDEVDRLDLGVPPTAPRSDDVVDPRVRSVAQKQESLGLRGAVYKRWWQFEGQRADLERALGFYLSGYRLGRDLELNPLGVETDHGYTGINAAFVLDLLAREEAEEARASGVAPQLAIDRTIQARAIREFLADALARHWAADPRRSAPLGSQWWFRASVAEAYFGLGQAGTAVEILRLYSTQLDLGDGPPVALGPGPDRVGEVPRWEFESTLTQLTALAQLHTDLAALLGDDFARPPGGAALSPDEWNRTGRKALLDYLDVKGLAPALERAERGKVGLALSGGGFRASFVHIGVLAYLAERDLLRRVEVLSCVSGGSIVGAHYYLELQKLLEARPDRLIVSDDYLDIVGRLEHDFLSGVQTNIRCQVFGSVWSNLRAFLQPGYTTTRRLGHLYERELYARVDDGKNRGPRYLTGLIVEPEGEALPFAPKYENWRRHAKVPMLVLNATTLNTGHAWQFTATWMGEPPLELSAEIESNYELRRLYYWEAPRPGDLWQNPLLRPFAPPDYRRIRLGDAVAASSCVPGLFEPLVFPGLYPGKVVRLVDGGVHDNQGAASLIEQDCNLLIVSDASGQMEADDNPKASRLGVSMRAFSVSMTRVRDAQYRELAARKRTGLVRGLMFMHLKRDLDSLPIDWKDCQDPHEASDDARPAARRGVLTGYGIDKRIQRLLAAIRTDLDSFTDLEARALMLTGYRQAEAQFDCLPNATVAPRFQRPWRFKDVEPLLAPGPMFEEVEKQLAVGSRTAFKIWMLSRPLQGLALAIAMGAVYGLWWSWNAFGPWQVSIELGTVRDVGVVVAWFVAGLLVPYGVALWRYPQTMRRIGLKSLGAAVVALLFKVHLLALDWLFLKLGNLDRLLTAHRQRGSA